MWIVNQSSTAARTALIYVTVGALTIIWTGMWYVYLLNNPPETAMSYYWCTGFLVTGLTLAVIGLGLGRISRSAQTAELPPKEVAVVAEVPTPAATAPVAAFLNSASAPFVTTPTEQ